MKLFNHTASISGPTKSSKEETPSPAIDAATAEEPIPVAVHESTVKNEQAAEAQAPSSSRSARSEKHSDEAASAPASARTAAPVAVADNAGSTEELQQPPPSQRSVKSTPREQEPTSTAAASPRSSSGADSAGPSGAAAAPAAADPPSSARSNPAATSAGAGSGSAKNTGRESARESAKDSARETVRESARDSARDSSKISPRGELTARTGSAKSVTNPATVATARSTASVEDKDTAEKKQEEYRLSLDYQPKELQISSIIIEGDQLVHANYDTVLVNVRIGSTEWLATTCMAREKGSKRRSYNVKWPELLVSADAFRNDSAIVTVAISDNAVAAANPVMPSLSTTQFGESPNSVSVPLYLLMQPSFDVVKEVRVEPIVAQKKGGPASSGVVKIFLHGNARDPKGLRTARIMSMRPQDLMNIKFDPILPLDDAEDLYESDEEEESVSSAPRSRGRKPGTIPESPQEMEDEELTRTLYPKASMANFSMANTAASVPAGAGAGVGGGVSNVMSQAASVETL